MAKLYVLDRELDSYHIVNNSIAIEEKNGSTFKVGEKIKTTSETIHTFRNFHVEKRTGVSQNVKYAYISGVTLTDGEGALLDAIGYLYFNSNKELIHLSIWQPSMETMTLT